MAYHQTYRLMERYLPESDTDTNFIWEWDKAPKQEEVQKVAKNFLDKQNRTGLGQLYDTRFSLMQEPAEGTSQKKEKEIRSFNGWDVQKSNMDLHRSPRYGMMYLRHTDPQTGKKTTTLLDSYDYLENHQFTTDDYLQNIADKLEEKGITPTEQDWISVLDFQIKPSVSTVDRNTGMVIRKATGEIHNPVEAKTMHPVFSIPGNRVKPNYQTIYNLRYFVPGQGMKVQDYWVNQAPSREELNQSYRDAASQPGVFGSTMIFYGKYVLNRSVCTLNSYGQVIPIPLVKWSKGVQNRNEEQGNLYQGVGEALEHKTVEQIREETREQEITNGEGKPRSKKDWISQSVLDEAPANSRNRQRGS